MFVPPFQLTVKLPPDEGGGGGVLELQSCCHSHVEPPITNTGLLDCVVIVGLKFRYVPLGQLPQVVLMVP